MKIVNLTATANFGTEIDLTTLHRPRKFSGAVIKGNKSTALVFKTGKIVVVGTTSVEAAYEAVLYYRDKLKLGSEICDFKVHNFVGSCSLGFQLDLNSMGQENNCIYSPEIFPGLTYTNNATVLLFRSGKCVITGCKTLDDIDVSYNDLVIFVKKFRQ